MRIPAAPASSSAARTGKKRSGTPTVPLMTATACSFLRSFMEADIASMAASRRAVMTSAMTIDAPWTGGTPTTARFSIADGGRRPAVGVVGELADEEGGDVGTGHRRADLVPAEEP